MHWHGFRQNYTVQQDGVPSITQCPDAPGTTHTYIFRATQYGTTWYHSHLALQAWMGVFGAIVIHGPTTQNYTEELEPIIINDWSHKTVDELWLASQVSGPPPLQNGLINGKGTYQGAGSRYEIRFEQGKSYKLRFINSAIDTFFKLSLDGHKMIVVAIDFVPIDPYVVDVLDITMGQSFPPSLPLPDIYLTSPRPTLRRNNKRNSISHRLLVPRNSPILLLQQRKPKRHPRNRALHVLHRRPYNHRLEPNRFVRGPTGLLARPTRQT
jgi:FtsP/CotA-like multicopper oxidase with cupredoxin domain